MSVSASSGSGVVVPTDAALGVSVDALFRAHRDELSRFLVAIVRDRSLAEDLLQDTFHDAVRAGAELDHVANPRAWLYAIARNRALQSLRRAKRYQRAFARLCLVTPDAESEPDDALVSLLELLERRLTPAERSLILLRYLHGFDAAELAEMTGASHEAVRQRLSRARARLLAADGTSERKGRR